MRKDSSWTLKGPDSISGDLVFDEREMCILRDIKRFGTVIGLNFIFMTSVVSNCLLFFERVNHIIAIIFTLIMAALLINIVIYFLGFLKARDMNNMVFQYSEIKKVEIKKKDKRVKIAFEFNDESKDKISIARDRGYLFFKDILMKNNILIVENQ